ncbi:hypothetical protein DES53_102793 [Roseimicrobium gellanilyticum]|uniref:Uncharacterized protein n=1 Tax=Roseimicrobium gellanilyticum TaxID=748857 RepID=A0A366HRU7_9BACT|nr:hypothetical protein [Roseimicrobium gellanilyticum]RBP46402.1 hypothetical protein DES53_102793 [Roseimicrobium gellanilyticum]
MTVYSIIAWLKSGVNAGQLACTSPFDWGKRLRNVSHPSAGLAKQSWMASYS